MGLKFTKSQALSLFYTQPQVDALIAGVSGGGIGTGDIFIGGDLTVTGDIFALGDLYLTGDLVGDATSIGTAAGPVDAVYFNTSYSDGQAEGKLQWNTDDGTLEIGMPGGNVNLQVGQEHIIRCRNITGSTISNGALITMTGQSGGKPTIGLAKADHLHTARPLGFATEEITNNSNGYITVHGLVRDVDTDGLIEGWPLWLSADTGGAYTNTRPTPPNFSIFVGLTVVAHASDGVILAYPSNVPRLVGLSDVYGTPSHGQVPTWDTGDLRFEFATGSGFDGTYAGDVLFGGALTVGTGDVTEFGNVLNVYYSGDLVSHFSYDGNLYLDGGVQASGASALAGDVVISGGDPYSYLTVGSYNGFPTSGGFLKLLTGPSTKPAVIQIEDESNNTYYLNPASDGSLHFGTSNPTGDPDVNPALGSIASRQIGWYMDGEDATGDLLAYQPLFYGEGPYNLTSALADYRTAPFSEATWDIEYCTSGDFVSTPSWASVFTTALTVDAGEFSSQSALTPSVFTGNLPEGARLRVRCTTPGTGDSATVSMVITGTT